MNANTLNGSLVSRAINATTAGTTNVNGAIIDMLGFESVIGIIAMGTLTASQVTELKWQAGLLANGSDMADILSSHVGPAADADSNKLLVSEFVKPAAFRYVRLVAVRGTANAVLDAAIYLRLQAHKAPQTTLDSTVSAQATIISNAYGTA